MPRAVRRFVLWLVIAILPVQGYAAATMVACGPIHERMASAATRAHDHDGSSQNGKHGHDGPGRRAHDHSAPDHGAHDHGAHGHGAHGHGAHDRGARDHAASAAHAPPAAMADSSTAAAAGGLADFTCSACAACCVGAALPAGDVSLDVSALAPDTLRPAAAAPLAAVTLDGLERPPRSFLA